MLSLRLSPPRIGLKKGQPMRLPFALPEYRQVTVTCASLRDGEQPPACAPGPSPSSSSAECRPSARSVRWAEPLWKLEPAYRYRRLHPAQARRPSTASVQNLLPEFPCQESAPSC